MRAKDITTMTKSNAKNKVKSNENIKIELSVLDTDTRYGYDYDETVYGGNDNIVSYGKDNDAPKQFKYCYMNSATLKSVIDGSVNYILGEDVVVNDEGGMFKERVNRTGMTMKDLIAKAALSYQMYGGFAVQVIYNKLGVPVELFPLDFGRCRQNESGTKIFYSKKNWTKYSTKSEAFDIFDPKHIDIEKPTQILYVKGDFTNNVYPLPEWFGAMRDILTEIEASKYALNSISNGFSARYLINLPDGAGMDDTQKEAIEDAIKNKFCGSETDANFLIYYADGDDRVEISKIESDDANERFISIKDNARSNIYTAMRCTPNLMGLPTATTGFNSQEYSSAFKLYQKSVIQPIQDKIVRSINKVIGKNAISIVPFQIIFEEN